MWHTRLCERHVPAGNQSTSRRPSRGNSQHEQLAQARREDQPSGWHGGELGVGKSLALRATKRRTSLAQCKRRSEAAPQHARKGRVFDRPGARCPGSRFAQAKQKPAPRRPGCPVFVRSGREWSRLGRARSRRQAWSSWRRRTASPGQGSGGADAERDVGSSDFRCTSLSHWPAVRIAARVGEDVEDRLGGRSDQMLVAGHAREVPIDARGDPAVTRGRRCPRLRRRRPRRSPTPRRRCPPGPRSTASGHRPRGGAARGARCPARAGGRGP